MTVRSDTRASATEVAQQLCDGLRVFGVGSQPIALARIALGGLPRYGMTLAGAVAITAKVHGDRVALIDDRDAITYAELGRATDRLAAALDHHRLAGPGTRIAVICHDDRDLLICAAAAGLTGARVTQLSPSMGRASFDAWRAANGVDLILGAPDAPVLRDHQPSPEHAGAKRTLGPWISTTEISALIAATPTSHPVPGHARRSASVMVTSGTTGVPKGIAIGRRASQPLAAFALAGATKIRPGVPTFVWPSLHHGYGLAAAVLCLIVGSPVVTASAVNDRSSAARRRGTDEHSAGPMSLSTGGGQAALAAIRRYGAGVVFGVPAQLRALARALDGQPAPRLRAVLSGSDTLDQTTVTALTEAFGPVLVNYYGSTEAGTFTMATGSMVTEPHCVGRPIVGSRIRIVDPDATVTRSDHDATGTHQDAARVVAVGEVGRVQVRTLTTSVTDEGSSWLTMGDLGYLDAAGRLHILGRAGDMTRLGGEFVHPDAVRDLLAAQPGVRDATVTVVDDDLYGRRLTASVHLDAHPAAAGPDAWRTMIRATLGPAAVPREIVIHP